MSTDTITVLTHPSLLMAKRWNTDGSITPYSTALHFKSRRVPLNSLDDLATLLTTLENSPRSCVIRGTYKGDEYAAANDPEHKPGLALRRKELHEDPPHHWLLVEVDDFEPLSCDPIEDPATAIDEYVTSSLPPAFHGVSCCWQLSNSAGHVKNAGKLKVHLWYWLETPYASEQLRAWAKAFEVPLDRSVLDSIQVHYTSRPLFAEGLTDPVPVRSGRITTNVAAVALDIPATLPESDKLTKRQVLEATYQSDPIAARLFDRNMVKNTGKGGELFIDCPCSELHTSESTETTTLYYPANTGGYSQGHFKCLHAHCVDAPQSDFALALGFSPADDFDEVLTAPAEDAPLVRKLTGPDRFLPVPAHLYAVAKPMRWLIKKVLPQAQLIILYGASTSGKSFVALDMACAIARGIDWRGAKTRQGRIAYVVAEGSTGFPLRLQAYALHHGLPLSDIDVHIVPAAPNLMKGDDVRDLIRALHTLGPLQLIVLDTLAQCMAGGNENASEDMGLAISQARVISEVLHTTVMFVHHTGKDDSKGARGHSSLKAAADAELEVARNGDERALSIGKQKDGKDGVDFGFSLTIVPLGHDEDGDVIDSCVITEARGSMENIKKRGKNKGANELLLLDAFNAIVLNPDDGITEGELLDKAIELKGEPTEQKARNNMKTNFIRALHALVRDDILTSANGMVKMLGK